MFVTDPAIAAWFKANRRPRRSRSSASAARLLVVVVGKWLHHRGRARRGAMRRCTIRSTLNDRLPPSVPMMTLEFHCASDTGRARSTTRTRPSSTRRPRWSCSPTAWAATTPARSRAACQRRSSRPSSAAGSPRRRSRRPTPTCAAPCRSASTTPTGRSTTPRNSNPQYAGMGTTLVVGVFRDNRLLLGHVGDSRCYRLRARPVRADHARSLAAAGADRRRPASPPSRRRSRRTRTW